MLEGTAKALLDLLKRLDQDPDVTYDKLVDAQREAVATAQEALDGLLALEGLCEATTLKTPTGRKRRRDRGQKRAKNGNVPASDRQDCPQSEEKDTVT